MANSSNDQSPTTQSPSIPGASSICDSSSSSSEEEEGNAQQTRRDGILRFDEEVLDNHPRRQNSLEALATLSQAAEPCSPDEPTLPKARAAWLALFGCWWLSFNSWGVINSYGAFQSFYRQDLLANEVLPVLSMPGAMQCCAVLLCSFVVGPLLDAGYYRHLTIIGTAVTTVGFFCTSLVSVVHDKHNYVIIIVFQGLLMGVGMSCFFVTSSQVVATWFVRRKGVALGVVSTGASIGGLIYPMMLRSLLPLIGFVATICAMGGLFTATSILSILFVKPNPVKQPSKPARWRDIIRVFDKKAFFNKSFVAMTAAVFLIFLGFYPIFFNLEGWAESAGVGYKPSGSEGGDVVVHGVATYLLLCTLSGSSTIGRLSVSPLCDKFGAVKIHALVALICSGLLYLHWPFIKTVNSAWGFVCVFGAFSGALISLPATCMAEIVTRNPTGDAKLGQWTGMMFGLAGISALVGPAITGAMVWKLDMNYISLQTWSATCVFLAFLCMACAEYCMPKKDPRTYKRYLVDMASALFKRVVDFCKARSRAEEKTSEESFDEKRRRESFGSTKQMQESRRSMIESALTRSGGLPVYRS